MDRPNKTYLYYPAATAYTVTSMVVGCVVVYVSPPPSGAPWPFGLFAGPVFGWAFLVAGWLARGVLLDIYGSYKDSRRNYEKKLTTWRDEEYAKSLIEQEMAEEWAAKKEAANG